MLGSGSILTVPGLGASSFFGLRERADKARLARMFTEHYQLVFRVVRRMGVPADAADDAAQQVFLVALERLGDIRPESERSFLYGTAVRVARSERRKLIREPATDTADLLSGTLPTADALADEKRAREVLDEVLERLGDDLRTVLVLHEFESLTMREIATIIDVPPGTVASRLRRAREVFMNDLRRALASSSFAREDSPREGLAASSKAGREDQSP